MVFVREAEERDFEKLEEILIENDMLSSPEIDGQEAMKRVKDLMGRYFLVAELNNELVGLIRGCYDGSRALIHQMAVTRRQQRKGIGKAMLYELSLRFKQDGAPSVSVTSGQNSREYYSKLGFSYLTISLMVAFDISKLIEKIHPKDI